MIAVDASAVLAIVFAEPEADEFRALLEAGGGLISPVNHWEVLARAYAAGGDVALEAADRVMVDLGLQVVEISEAHSRAAVLAFKRFGKGVRGPLNLGDCFAYALAEAEGEGLLFKGGDFPKTDVKPAI